MLEASPACNKSFQLQATYVPSSFASENNKHTHAIRCLQRYMNENFPRTQFIVHPGKNDLGYDVIIGEHSVEIKTNRGANNIGTHYPTWLLETYTDHECTILPEYRKTQALTRLVIYNQAKQTAYVYAIDPLRAYVKQHEKDQVPSGVGAGQYKSTNKLCGWGIKIPWVCKEAGFLFEINLSEYQ